MESQSILFGAMGHIAHGSFIVSHITMYRGEVGIARWRTNSFENQNITNPSWKASNITYN
jgi:hypothetical protein